MEIGTGTKVRIKISRQLGNIMAADWCTISNQYIYRVKISTGHRRGDTLVYYARHIERFKPIKPRPFSAWR